MELLERRLCGGGDAEALSALVGEPQESNIQRLLHFQGHRGRRHPSTLGLPAPG